MESRLVFKIFSTLQTIYILRKEILQFWGLKSGVYKCKKKISVHLIICIEGDMKNSPLLEYLKSDNLWYDMLDCWVDVTIVSLTKRLMFRALLFFS